MSVIRQDPTTREWVIVAADRGKRPRDLDGVRTRAPIRDQSRVDSCAFCPGNEARTPGELLRLPGLHGADWGVRVIPNKFPALAPGGEPRRRASGPLFREMNGAGHHEVIVETASHNRRLALMTEGEVEQVLHAYQVRYRAVREDPRIRSILIFKNHGERAGTSLAHPHSQLIATPIVSRQIREKCRVAITHHDDTGRCLYCDLVTAEATAKVRLVRETDRFVLFHPFASRVPFETWIVPVRHQPSFGQVSDADLSALAPVLRETLLNLSRALGNPDFNYVIHSVPVEDESKRYFHWHVQLLPRLTTIAGFELGSGMFVTTMAPEETAAFMRKFEIRRCRAPA